MPDFTGSILIIDDSKENCALLQDFLTYNGFEVEVVYTGKDSKVLLSQKEFDIALIDIDLPDDNGLELILKIFEIQPKISCAMVTGVDSAEKASQAFKSGAFDYFVKPIVMEDLLHSIQGTLENNHLRRQLELSQSQIVQQERMVVIGQLAAGVAHEINNPVGFINSNLSTLVKYFDRISQFLHAQTELLENSLSSEAAQPIIDLKRKLKIDFLIDDIAPLISESLEGTERIKKIVQDLKLFSRQDAEKESIANINDSIESALNIVWNELKYTCKVDKDLGDLPHSLCFPQKLSQVFMNILVNAGHAIKENGVITIRSWHENGVNKIDITDSGCGMSKSVIARIFDPFYTTKEPGKGTGLGMSVAAEIVAKHEGTISVDSIEGQGTTFHIFLPIRTEDH